MLDLLILSTCEKFVFGAFTDKTVVCWDLATATVRGSIHVNKRLTSMIYRAMDLLLPGNVTHSLTRSFTHSLVVDTNKGVLIASDKAGDVWAIDTPLLSNKVLVAGHTASVITDVTQFSIDNQDYVATSDRDEKIRISMFPQFVQIKTYCLGHTNVVTSVIFMEKFKLLVTCGWDHAIYLWEPVSGSIVNKIFTRYRSTTTETSETNENEEDNDATDKAYDHKKAGNYPIKIVIYENVIAIIFSGISMVLLYTVSDDGNVYNVVESKTIALSSPPADIYFSKTGNLCVLLPPPDHIIMYSIKLQPAVDAVPSEQYSEAVAHLRAVCHEKSICFNQEMILMAEEGHNSGLEKEILKTNHMEKWKERRDEQTKKRLREK